MKKLLAGLVLMVSGLAYAQHITLYGLTLGEKIDFPECPPAILNSVIDKLSIVDGVDEVCIKKLAPQNGNANLAFIIFPKTNAPEYSISNVVLAEIDDQKRLSMFNISTGGKSVQGEIFGRLILRLGAPIIIEEVAEGDSDLEKGSIYAVWKYGNGDWVAFMGHTKYRDVGVIIVSTGEILYSQQKTPM